MSELLRYLISTRDAFKDPRRLHSLYGDFTTQEHSNPEGYQANLDEWRHALIAAAREGVIPAEPTSKEVADSRFVVSTGQQLLKALETRQYGIPVALGRVVEDAVAKRSFVEMQDFETAQNSIYQRRWMPQIPSLSDILIWGWKQVGFGWSANQSLPNGQWVIPENLEAASSLVLKVLDSTSTSPTETVQTLTSLRAALPFPFTDSDIQLLLTYLSRDKPRLTYKYITDTEAIIKPGTAPLTDTDLTIANLKALSQSLCTQVTTLESSFASLATQARNAVEAKNTSAARAALKRKKIVADALEKRRDEVFTIQQTLVKIDQAVDQVAIVRVMQSSADTLKRLNAEVGGVEGAEKVTQELADQMDVVEEVGRVINEPGAVAPVVDEMEVEDEFDKLMQEQADKEHAEQEKAEKAQKEREEEETRRKMKQLEDFEREKRAQAEKEKPAAEAEVETATKDLAEMSL